MMWPKKVLLTKPNGFRIEYAINPYMLDSNGNLQTVDSRTALAQWEMVKKTFSDLGLGVEVVEGREEFPDMVFCANQTLPVRNSSGKTSFVLSRMKSEKRKGEVPYFADWARASGFEVFQMTDFDFEGGGDAIWNYETGELFGGYGFRTDPRAYDILEQQYGVKALRLRLVSEDFYHMDTCLAILSADAVAFVPSAFDPPSQNLIAQKFSKRIEIDPTEARQFFAGNSVALADKRVIVQKGAVKFCADLRRHGFNPIEVDTGEFIKAGGGPFCIKQLFW